MDPIYLQHYPSPLGKITMAAQADALIGLWFEGQKYDLALPPQAEILQGTSRALEETKRWLDIYFTGKEPDFLPPLRLWGSPFRKLIGELMLEIPFGSTSTYRELAEKAAKKLGKEHMSAQAVGGAVAHNPLSLVVPCHRVLGSDGSLTGYAGGLWRKEQLLEIEKGGGQN